MAVQPKPSNFAPVAQLVRAIVLRMSHYLETCNENPSKSGNPLKWQSRAKPFGEGVETRRRAP